MEQCNSCSICLDSLHQTRAVGTTIPCGHVFHVECFRDWEQQNQERSLPCPNCNACTTGFQKLFIHLAVVERRSDQIPALTSSSISSSEQEENDYVNDDAVGDEAGSALGDLHGCFVFQALIPLAVRRELSVGENHKTEEIIQQNELVSVDYIRKSRYNHGNGPFLRLSDCKGWLFEYKNHEQVMKQLEVTDGLWNFYADNYPVGIGLRRHPMDRPDIQMKPKVDFLPMQKIVCDLHAEGPNGVNYYRVQGTDGWVFDKRGDNFMIISASKVRKGLFIYKAKTRLAIRAKTNVGDECKTPLSVTPGELIAADVIRESPYHNTGNGPFLRLTDSSGWLFEEKYSKSMMEALPVHEGDWSFRVGNAPIGVALRRQPIDSQNFKVLPERVFSPGEVVACAYRARGANGVNFYRVKGTDGWVFDKRGDEQILFSFTPALQSAGQLSTGWSPDYVRRIASSVPGVFEIAYNSESRLISFRTSGDVRVNVYYTTRTVGTAMDHPVQGKTQMFRRNCTVDELISIFRNPRVHSGKGYQTKGTKRPRLSRSPSERHGSNDMKSEEDAVRESLRAFDDELALVASRRSKILLQLKAIDGEHATSALRDKNKVDEMVVHLKEVQERKNAEMVAQLKVLQRIVDDMVELKTLERQKPGDQVTACMFNSEEISLDSSAKLFAMGGRASLMITKNGGWAYTRGLTTAVHKLLHTRALSHPKPMYVALGSNNRYFIQFANGKAQWSGSETESFDDAVNSGTVRFVAFGTCSASYVVATSSCTHWNNVPNQLERILYGNKPIHCVSMGPAGEYFVAWKDGTFKGGGWSNELNSQMGKLKRQGWHVRDVKFGDADSYIVRYSSYSGPF